MGGGIFLGHKVDISEVIDFSDEFKLTSEEIKDSLLKVELCIEEFCNMSSFSGETADQAKLYFIDFHLTVLTTFKGVLTDLFNKLNNHIETFQSRVDKSSRAIVQSHYLTDVMEDVNKGNRTLQAEHKVVSNIIRSVSDISSATTPSLSDIEQAHHSVVNKVEDLLEDLVSFTRINKNGVLQVGNILKEIETTLNHVGAVNGNARFTNYKGDSTTKGLATLKDYNKTIVDIRQINSKSIQYMSIYEIERLMGATLKDMDETGRKILNYALIDLKNGKIDRKIYYSIFSTMIKSTKQLSEKELNEEVPQSVIRYLYDNKVEIGLDLAVNFIVESAKYIGQEVKVIGKGVGALATDIRTIGELFSRISNRTGNIIKIIGNATMKTSNFISKTGQFVQISGKV